MKQIFVVSIGAVLMLAGCGSQTTLSTDLCPGVRITYDQVWSYVHEFDLCTNASDEAFFRIRGMPVDSEGDDEFYNTSGVYLGSIYGYDPYRGYNAPVEEDFDPGELISCEVIDVATCNIIDLDHSFRGSQGILPSYARTCQQTFEHMDIWPDSVDTLSTEAWRDRSGRYWMCTDDKEIFYINYTGSRIADTRWENANYDTLFFYNTRGQTIGYTKDFILTGDWGLAYGIPQLFSSPTNAGLPDIHRCTSAPIDDCYYEVMDIE